MKKQTETSVVILNYNDKLSVIKLIQQLRNQTYKKTEIIVVDNNSSDGSIGFIQKKFPGVKLIRNRQNIGASAKNIGIAAARGRFVVVLDNDIIIDRFCVKKFVHKLKLNKNLGIACSEVFDYQTQKFIGPNHALSGNNQIGFRVSFFAGSAIAIRKSLLAAVGGFSQKYFMCLEELEWAVRILKAGYEIKCFPDIKVFNKKTEVGGSYRKRQGFWYSRNWIWFYIQYLPFPDIISFLNLHRRSVIYKTKSSRTMKLFDCLFGLVVGIITSPYFLFKREPLKKSIVDRIKLDLFPNPYHLYVNH